MKKMPLQTVSPFIAVSLLVLMLLAVITPCCSASTSMPSTSSLRARGLLGDLVNQVGGLLGGGGGGSGSNGNVTGWSNTTSTNPCSGWTGILCNANNVVTGLVLDGLQIVGSVPTALDSLTNLTTLTLSHNRFNGSIPNTISTLTHLITLDLSSNLLSGTIPILTNLTNLVTLNLSNNSLIGSIPPLTGLTSLIHLDLSNNLLNGTIPNLSTLVSLEYLDLSGNDFEGQMPDLSGLKSLKILKLNGNKLVGPFPSLAHLTNLTRVILSDNVQLLTEGLSATLLEDLPNLIELTLDNTGIRGLLPALNLLSLEILSVEDNLLCGELPAFLANPIEGLVFSGDCNCLFKSWCSLTGSADGSCRNGGFGGACDASRCAATNVAECLITNTVQGVDELTNLIFPDNVPTFVLEREDASGREVSVEMGMASLVEVDSSGNVIHTEAFPESGNYLVDEKTILLDGIVVMEYTFEAKLSNGAEIAVAYYMSVDSAFEMDWGDTRVSIPQNSVKYTFTARGWPFTDASNRLRLVIDMASTPAVGSSDDNEDDVASATTNFALQVRDVSAQVEIALYRHALVFTNATAGSVLEPSGAFRSVGVSTRLADDLGSITIEFPSFDAGLGEVLSYDPSLGVLYGGSESKAGGDGSNTWIIAVAVAVPVASVVVLVAAVIAFGVFWRSRRSWQRKTMIGPMVPLDYHDCRV